LKSRIHLYALGSLKGKAVCDHFGHAHLWTEDFDPATTTPLAVAVECFVRWHKIPATEADFEVTATYESTEQARERYKVVPEKVHVIRYRPHVTRAAEIGAQFVDHFEVHGSWWVRKIETEVKSA
jgi:hypothetical protein